MIDIIIYQFEQTFSTPKSNMTITDTFFNSANDLKDIITPEQLIEYEIKSTPSHSAAGIDGEAQILHKECALARPLSFIFEIYLRYI